MTADRPTTNPLFNGNRLKLGTFATNCSRGAVATTAEGTLELTWEATRALAKMSDSAGFEALVPVARWRGFDGLTNFGDASFETFTWAAGLMEATHHICVFATCHTSLIHPFLAAKQGATLDHISGGRFALNVVMGHHPAEFDMFGAGIQRDHDESYRYGEEWMEVLCKLWTEDQPFDYQGRFINSKGGYSRPHPIQQPMPPVMSAHRSEMGSRFAAKYADLSFVILPGAEASDWKAAVDEHKRLAREEFGREQQVWMNASVICRPTEKEAEDYYHHVAFEAVDPQADPFGRRGLSQTFQDGKRRIPGYGGFPLIGTPETILADLTKISRAGIDGCLLHWVNNEVEQEQWVREVLPLMEQAGLRKPFSG